MDYRRESGNLYKFVKFDDNELRDIDRQITQDMEAKPSPAAAAKMGYRLIGSFREATYLDPKIFAATLASVFTEHSTIAGETVVRALPRKLKFVPAISEVEEALEALERPAILISRSIKIVLQSRAEERQAAANFNRIEKKA